MHTSWGTGQAERSSHNSVPTVHVYVVINKATKVSFVFLFVQEKEGVEAVSVGAILSDYQRIRVENV